MWEFQCFKLSLKSGQLNTAHQLSNVVWGLTKCSIPTKLHQDTNLQSSIQSLVTISSSSLQNPLLSPTQDHLQPNTHQRRTKQPYSTCKKNKDSKFDVTLSIELITPSDPLGCCKAIIFYVTSESFLLATSSFLRTWTLLHSTLSLRYHLY